MRMIAGLALRIPIFMGNTREIKYHWLNQKHGDWVKWLETFGTWMRSTNESWNRRQSKETIMDITSSAEQATFPQKMYILTCPRCAGEKGLRWWIIGCFYTPRVQREELHVGNPCTTEALVWNPAEDTPWWQHGPLVMRHRETQCLVYLSHTYMFQMITVRQWRYCSSFTYIYVPNDYG